MVVWTLTPWRGFASTLAPDLTRLIVPRVSISGGARRAPTLELFTRRPLENESAMRFICFRCVRARRRTKIILFGALALLLLIVLLLERLGLLH